MTTKIELTGECRTITLKLYREPDGKYSVSAHLEDPEGKMQDSQQVTERRSLTSAVEELVNAAYSMQVSLNRTKLSLSTPRAGT